MIPPTNDILETVRLWMGKAEQIGSVPEINIRRSGFQVGMQLEELAEKLELILPTGSPFVRDVKAFATYFKNGSYDSSVAMAIQEHPTAFLDGDIDLLWVTAGAIAAQGANGPRAWEKVNEANWAKYPNGDVTLDSNGKVIKPEGWTAPDLYDCTFEGRLYWATELSEEDDNDTPPVYEGTGFGVGV